MSRILRCFALTLLVTKSGWAKDYLETFLPETTLLSVSIDSAPGLLETMDSGALGKLISEEKREEWLSENDEPFELDDGEQYLLPGGEALSFSNIEELINGRISFSIVSLDEGEVDPEPNIVIMADFGGDLDAYKFLQTIDRGEDSGAVLLLEEDYAGTTLFIEELDFGDEDSWAAEYWALVDGIAIETTSLELLKNTVDAVLDGSARDSLAESADFQRALDLAGEGQMRAYANLGSAVTVLQDYMKNEIGELPLNPLGVTFDSLWSSLALDTLDAAFASIDVEGEYLSSSFGFLYDERRGLLSLMAYSQDPIEYPHWVPEDAVKSTVAMIDFQGAWTAFEGLMNDMSPNFGALLQLQLDNFREKSGIDLRESLINNFGEHFYSFSLWEDESGDPAEDDSLDYGIPNESMVFAIPVRDPQAFQNSIKAMTEVFLPGMEVIQEREFLDYTIFSLNAQAGGDSGFGYALANDYLFVGTGSIKPLERTLYRLNESDDGLWSEVDVVNALKELPPNPIGNEYYDLGQAMEKLSGLLQPDWTMGALDDSLNPEFLEIFQDVELPYIVLSGAYVLDGAQVNETIIIPKE
ncbi:MAG: hypothetical protein AAFX93_02165 [Verrucomicrobiota bacterium]